MVNSVLPLRGTDDFGSGAFGASRGSRKHKGIDYACYPETLIKSTVAGMITKIGYPYADALEFRYVEVTDLNELRHRFFYVDPLVDVGNYIMENDVIGSSQAIAEHYNTPKKTMKNHVHYEVLDTNNEPVDPNEIT